MTERGRRRVWPRRAGLTRLATAVTVAGVLMLLQPFLMVLFTYSFVTILGGTLLLTVVSKLPE